MSATETTEKCKCRICERHEKFKNWLETIPVSARAFAEELLMELDHAEDDACYWRSVADGSWPQADEIIAYKRKNHLCDKCGVKTGTRRRERTNVMVGVYCDECWDKLKEPN